MFCSELGEGFDPRTYSDLFYRVIKSAGVKNINFHCIRHTFASRLSEQGVETETIAKIVRPKVKN